MKPRETTITGYFNVYNDAKWHTQWGELTNETLSLYSSKTETLKPNLTINVKEINIQPAVKETGHKLAFKLVEKGNTKLLVEPLDITDMGRWISSLFMAIQGVITLEQEQNESESNEGIQNRKHTMSTTGVGGERQSCLVDVKKIAQMFESMAKKALQQSEPTSSLRRTQSSPNLLNDGNFSVLEKQTELKSMKDNSNEDTKPIVVATILKVSKEADVKSWKGPYKAQDTEKQVLRVVSNSFLAKRRLTKHEKQIKKMEATIREINSSVERQKKSLAETKEIISVLQNKTSETKEQEEITKLENDCTHLEIQIQQSEQNVEHYKLLIQQIEDEMNHRSPSVHSDQVQNEEELSSVDVLNHNGLDKTEQEENTLESEHEEQEEERPKNSPVWAKQAQEKSKKAYKILSEQGKLD